MTALLQGVMVLAVGGLAVSTWILCVGAFALGLVAACMVLSGLRLLDWLQSAEPPPKRIERPTIWDQRYAEHDRRAKEKR